MDASGSTFKRRAMIIRDIHIDGFGVFHNHTLGPLQKGVNIILGDNEAGKSTLLKFLRYTLFGYPRFTDQRMTPLHGGNHGGRIQGLLASGQQVVFERNGADKIRLLHDGKETSDSNLWNHLLGNASAGLYNKVYTFTLDELVGLSSLEESGVEDRIFSMGMGLGNVSVADVETAVRSRMEEIYTLRGRTQKIPALLREIEQKQQQVRQMRDQMDLYRQLSADIDALQIEIQANERMLPDVREEQARLDGYLRCYESFVQVERAEQELAALPPLQQLPENGLSQLESLMEKKSSCALQMEQLEQGTPEERGTQELEGLLRETTLNTELLEKKDEVDFIRLNLSGYKQTLSERTTEGEELKALDAQIISTIRERISSRWTEHDVSGFSDIRMHHGQVEEFISASQQLREELRDRESQEKVLSGRQSSWNAGGIALTGAGLLAVLAVPFFYYGLSVAGGALLLAAIGLLLGRKYFVKEDPLVPVKEKIRELRQAEEAYLASCRTYIERELKLSPRIPFHMLAGVFQTIEQVKGWIVQRDAVRKKLQEQRLPLIYDYEGKVKALARGLRQPVDTSDIPLLAQAIMEEYDAEEEAMNQLLQAKDELERKTKALQQKEAERKTAHDAWTKLLDGAGVADEAEFRLKYSENEKVREWTQIRDNALEKIEVVAGLNKAEEVMEYLKSHDKHNLELRLSELKTTITEKEQKNRELYNRKGASQKEKERIAGTSDLAEKLTELESERQKLRDAYKQWLSGQVAMQVLAQVKTRYEKDKQPAVIKNAGTYFHTITRGRYTGIRASLEGKEMSVYDERQATKTLEQLSRGTREQLLVSLRLGFIDEYETHAEPLPVVVDEILVNFDAARARHAAQLLQSFAQNRQLLLFTCHPSTLELFDRDRVNVIKLG
ncbi:MAG: hypothetical protein EA361_14235 [Bacteroidetes bacterium]|nr:MAG: hypothetical protein EA361_14235 [Bacteroidota bacterium]